jgi:glycerol-3-phosphate dehydrogenase
VDAGVPLPGGDFGHDEVARMVGALMAAYPFLDARWALRLIRAYGTEAREMLDGGAGPAISGRASATDLTEAEVVWLMEREWARTRRRRALAALEARPAAPGNARTRAVGVVARKLLN